MRIGNRYIIVQSTHAGSASAMEVAGEKLIYNRSLDKHKLRYTEFYGNSKSFNSVKDVIFSFTKSIENNLIYFIISSYSSSETV